jgi:hypothetical protein
VIRLEVTVVGSIRSAFETAVGCQAERLPVPRLPAPRPGSRVNRAGRAICRACRRPRAGTRASSGQCDSFECSPRVTAARPGPTPCHALAMPAGRGSAAMRKTRDRTERGSRWAVYDIVLDGTSLVSTYRNQFKSSIRTSSFAQLMERMRTERLRQPARAAGASVRANELEPSQRRSEGLLLGARR